MRVDAERERRWIVAALEHVGVERPAADVQAEWLLEGDLRSHPSHGIQRLPVLVERVRRGLVNPAARAKLEWASDAALVVDGDAGLGPWVGSQVVAALAARAQETGVAAAAVRNAHHLGLLSLYVERAAERGLVCIALTTSEALVHPWGGARALIGTNPIAIGVPARPEPFVLDMATSEVSMGKVLAHRNRGEALEPGWAIDADGEPTDDPASVAALTPFGGAKGYGLGLGFELVVSILSGTALGTDVRGTLDVEHPPSKGDIFICVSPERFGVGDEALGRVERYLGELRGSSGPGAPPVAVPGDGARSRRQKALREGIELPDELVGQLRPLMPTAEVFA